MEFNDKQIRELAERIYDLDFEVYETLGSSLGRIFNNGITSFQNTGLYS